MRQSNGKPEGLVDHPQIYATIHGCKQTKTDIVFNHDRFKSFYYWQNLVICRKQ